MNAKNAADRQCSGDAVCHRCRERTRPRGTGTDQVKCVGANSCKGQSSCKSAQNDCKGKNACKGQGFVKTTAQDCKDKGGTVATPDSK